MELLSLKMFLPWVVVADKVMSISKVCVRKGRTKSNSAANEEASGPSHLFKLNSV